MYMYILADSAHYYFTASAGHMEVDNVLSVQYCIEPNLLVEAE